LTAVVQLMAPEDFASRMVGVRWQRWASEWDRCDCFGLVVLYFRAVLGIDLGSVPQTDIAAGFAQASGWRECGPGPGSTAFMTWRDGAPTHCGVLLAGGRLLHAKEGPAGTGSVQITRLTVMARLCKDLRFYTHEAVTPC
jgi:cell wall-associated NlpC family hydrolase